jgi:CBS domain-containing protein
MLKQYKAHSHSKMKSSKESHLLSELCESDVVCLEPSNTIYDAAKEMLEKHIGNVVITEERDGKVIPVGIVTDRDIVINSTAKKLDPESVKLSSIMTKKIVTVKENEDLTTLIKILTDEGVGRIPVVDEAGALMGILSSKRIFQYFAQGLCELSSLSVQQHRREEKVH